MPDLLAAASRNMLSLLGSALALVSGVCIVVLMAMELLGVESNPYVGIITYVIMPTLFAMGLVLVVWGIRRERKRAMDGRFPVIDLNVKRTRNRVMTFIAMVSVCVVILATATSGAVHYMESNTFCGTVCHEVMSPEYTAFQHSPHAHVQCVDCHVGPGAGGFLKAKVNGAWQMVSAVLDLHHRPIPTPVHDLPDSSVTCEKCHWPGKYHGSKPKLITRFNDDEANTETKTVLLMNVGGNAYGEVLGIHWHTDPDVQIRYRSDESRRHIHEVELSLPDGTVKRYASTEDTGDDETAWHTMQCIDCHNRPAHVFQPAGRAVDEAIERGFIARDLPYVRREGAAAIGGEYESHEQARQGITTAITEFYRTEYPSVADEHVAEIDEACRVLGDIYARNVFPSMNVDGDTYPSFLGHDDGSTGCFRCHSGNHATADGEVITVDCRACHGIIAWDEASQDILEVLRTGRRPAGAE